MTGHQLEFNPAPGIACVDLPAFPLQIALRDHPDWGDDPVVVVEDDRPLAGILWANRAARAHRIRRGMKFAAAQSLVARLHGAVVSPADVDDALGRIFVKLVEYSPNVEPSREWPGVFWVDPSGLEHLHGSLEDWADRVWAAIGELGFASAVVVGSQRFGVFAFAQSRTGAHVLRDAAEEKRRAAAVPLSRLNISAKLRDEMAVLGVETLGDLLALPRRGLAVRYGEEAGALHDLASDRTWTPLQAQRIVEPTRTEVVVDPPDSDQTRLLFGMKSSLHEVLRELERRGRGITALGVTFELDHGPDRFERIETAAPTLDIVRLLDLVRLRLSSIELAAPVERIEIDVKSVAVHAQQGALLDTAPPRDPGAAGRALARVKAAFGPSAVTRARLESGILPEARFRWEPFGDLPVATVGSASEEEPPPLVRSVLEKPAPLPDPPRHERERWLGRHGAVERMFGPDRVTSGWWADPVSRDYFWVETQTHEILWLFQDRATRGWALHGRVD
jgi:protein ImuB